MCKKEASEVEFRRPHRLRAGCVDELAAQGRGREGRIRGAEVDADSDRGRCRFVLTAVIQEPLHGHCPVASTVGL